MKTAYLHMGLPKTGSTAIQHYLRDHSDKLKELGYLYEASKEEQREYIASGNAKELVYYARKPLFKIRSIKVRAMIKKFARGSYSNIIFSDEGACRLSIHQLEKLFHLFNKNKIDLVLIYYVRNIQEVALSCYSQLVKRHGLTTSFEDSLDQLSDSFPLQNILQLHQHLQQKKTSVQMLVRNYNLSNNLISDFITNVLSIPQSDLPDTFAEQKVINRKLNKRELEFIIEMNKDHELHKYSRKVADLLEKGNYIEGHAYTLTPSQIDLVTNKTQSLINQINLAFPSLSLK